MEKLVEILESPVMNDFNHFGVDVTWKIWQK